MKRLILAACAALALSTGAASAQKMTVLLDWFVNPDHGPLYVAQALGEFEKRGLEVEFIAPADPNDPPKLVAAKQAEIAISYQPQLHLQVDQGLPLRRIGTLVATPLNALVVLADGPIRSIADLKGRKVGFSVGGFEDAMLSAMLTRHGLTMDDIKLVNVNFSLSPSLISGQVDAVIGAFRNFELNQMDIVGRPGRAFYVEAEGVPAYDELILVAHEATLDDPRYLAFLEAIEAAVQYMVNEPEEAWALFLQQNPDLDDELNRRAWADTLPRFALRPRALDRRRYDEFAKFLKHQGLIGEAKPAEAYAVELR
ncbi:MAG: ABC transporter ATP-binding protein [Rhizobiales bacterium NRL2]|jgi:putative hydroxymethylpyrimidine transport system substrate-binding protein|nr:MAG: ABC transporter ATP-binding protein [Rhizobiales bacterium NRL2]